jgi:hypothetical protein
MEEQAAPHRRGRVGAGTRRFAGLGLVLSLGLVVVNATGVGASGVAGSLASGPPGSTAPAAASGPVSTTRGVGPHYLEAHAVVPAPAAVAPTPPVAPDPPAVAGEVSTPPPASPPPAEPSVVPARGTATASGCAAAVAYLAAYSAPGFTYECPGSALGHQAMTCIDEPGVCADEHLIAIADACPAAYMNEASNSWVLTGSSDAPIDPYGACT